MGRLLVTLATVLVLLLGAAAIAPAFIDWKIHRAEIENAASTLLGRKISIVGDIDIALLPAPHLRAKKVIAEGAPSEAAQMTAEAVDLTLSLEALFSGRVEAAKLKLVNPFFILDLSKPLQSAAIPAKGQPLALSAGVTSLEIEGGRISIYPDAGQKQALTVSSIDGAFNAPQQGSVYRFAGRGLFQDRPFDVKFMASLQRGVAKLTGSATDIRTKAAIQADGVLSTADVATFDGLVSAAIPRAAVGVPFDIQAKGRARLDRAGMALSDVVMTIDPENRPQIVTGSAALPFGAGSPEVSLEARLLDADALVSAVSGGEAAGWSGLEDAAERALSFYPDLDAKFSFAADQIQLGGEFIERAKIEGERARQKWLFENAEATLPGATALKMTGVVKRNAAGNSELMARLSAEGKNLSRLNRWIAPAARKAGGTSAKAFKAEGLLTLSGDVTSFTEVKAALEGTPLAASLRLDKRPQRKLKLSLSGDRFDFTGLADRQAPQDALSGESAKTAIEALLAPLSPLLGDDPASLDAADIDVSAAAIRAGFIEAKNVTVQIKYDQDTLTVARLRVETADGLSLQGEGVVPLRADRGQGRFQGRVEAASAQAVLQAAALAGYGGANFVTARAEDIAPASFAMTYSADAGANGGAVQLGASFGPARLDGRVQLKGDLSQWRDANLSGQATLSSSDGGRLMALMLPGAAADGPLAPGSIAIRLNGTPARLTTAATVKAPLLQAQVDGVADMTDAFSFTGKLQASSGAPEQILPPPLLALLGGERQASFKVETSIAYEMGRFDATKLKAESPKNTVGGQLAVSVADRTRIDADLKADQLSLPAILAYLLAPPPQDRGLVSLALAASSSGEVWSDRPFALPIFQGTDAKIRLAAKTLWLSGTLALSDAQLSASLDDARLGIDKLQGKLLGGDFGASLSLDASAATVAASASLSLAKADLSALPLNTSPPLATGKASLSLRATGQGLSPRGLLSVLQGKGFLAFGDGQLAKFSPASVQKGADDMLASPLPLTEGAIKKRASDAVQSADLKYRHLKAPIVIRDGMLAIRRASFRGKDATVRMEALVDLSNGLADTTWQAGAPSDKRMKWPPVKVQLSGPVRELGAKARMLSAEDFARAVLVRKMEGDIKRLETLSGPQPPSVPWGAKQETAPPPERQKGDGAPSQAGVAPIRGGGEFEQRMRDALSKSNLRPEPQ